MFRLEGCQTQTPSAAAEDCEERRRSGMEQNNMESTGIDCNPHSLPSWAAGSEDVLEPGPGRREVWWEGAFKIQFYLSQPSYSDLIGKLLCWWFSLN